MKHINIVYEDEEYKEIEDLKKELKLGWHDFLIKLVSEHQIKK